MIRSRLVAVATLAVLTLTLSGCVRMGVEVELKPNDMAVSSVVLAVEDKYLDQTGQSPDAVIDTLTEGQGDPAEDAVRTEDFEQDGYTGTRYVYPKAKLGGVGARVGWPIEVVRTGGDYVVSGTLDLTEESLGSRGGSSVDNLSVTVDITFPGKVKDSNGTIDGNSVRWEPTVGEAVEISARGSAVAPPEQGAEEAAGASEVVTLPVVPEWMVLVLGLSGLIILLLIGVIVWQAMLRVRDRRPEVAGDAPVPPQQAPHPALAQPAPQQYGGVPSPYGAAPPHPQEQPTPGDPSRPPSFPPGY
ncbi:LppM family (lipo)protein [Promicromonospora vindobonensis]|uniref:LppM family (Lipo)protein n=1 Tax=Promicromonospora vindobonensis TaxID=195748 RepID=A0ABW5VRH2_9MICO